MLIWKGILRGAERHVFDLARYLPAQGYAPTICFFSTADTYAAPLAAHGIPFTELRNRNTKLSLSGIARYWRLLRGGDFDIVHDHGAPLWARFVTAAAGVPLVYTEHITRFTPYRRRLYRLVQRVTRATIAVSQAARDALIEQLAVPPESIAVVPNAVAPERFEGIDASDGQAVRAEAGVPADATVLASVGRLTAAKRFGVLIDALGPLLAQRQDVHLVIVGEGEERDALLAQSAAVGVGTQVHLLGRRLDIPRVLAAADVFVFMSGEESFGIAVAEAMLAGKPVVATRLPAVAEVVEDGVTGYLVGSDDSRSFRSCVEELVSDPARRTALGRAGRARAIMEFAPELMAARVAQVYDSVIGPRL